VFLLSGTSDVRNGYALSYILQPTPIPEPGTYALMLLGLGALAFGARRRGAR
jgi:hypothetical protein